MYSRKSFGYNPSYTPPPNYNGVAFTRNFKPYADIVEGSEKAPEENKNEISAFEAQSFNDISEPVEETGAIPEKPSGELFQDYISPCDSCSPEAEACGEKECEKGCEKEGKNEVASLISGKDLKIEDLLIIGAVILFVSGEFDGDLMLLLGLLLVAGI